MMHLERVVVGYSVNVECAQVDIVVLDDCDQEKDRLISIVSFE